MNVVIRPFVGKLPDLEEQKGRITRLFPGIDLSCVDRQARQHIPDVSSGLAILPKLAFLANFFGGFLSEPKGSGLFGRGDLYGSLVDNLIRFQDGWRCELDPKHLHLSRATRERLQKWEAATGGDVLVAPLSFRFLFLGFAPIEVGRRISEKNLFVALGSAQGVSLIGLIPELLKNATSEDVADLTGDVYENGEEEIKVLEAVSIRRENGGYCLFSDDPEIAVESSGPVVVWLPNF